MIPLVALESFLSHTDENDYRSSGYKGELFYLIQIISYILHNNAKLKQFSTK